MSMPDELPTLSVVGAVNDTKGDFEYLFSLYQEMFEMPERFCLDCTYAYFLRQNAVAFLGGMVLMARQQGKEVSWKKPTDGKVISNLLRNEFGVLFGEKAIPRIYNAILFKHYTDYKDEEIVFDFLYENWLQPHWIDVSDELKQLIVGRVAEIYMNAFTHSQSAIGVTSCGQYYPNLKELKLTIVDFGVGIPSNVRAFLKNDNISSEECMRWAFADGHTTATDSNISRGIGLGMLDRFVRLNQGKLEIYSDNAYTCIDKDGQRFEGREQTFRGTIVNITLNCKEVAYLLASENEMSEDSVF